MKISTSISALGLWLAATFGIHAENDFQAMMRFHNDDLISGKLKSLGDDSLVWESDILAEPATFQLENVLNLTLNAENEAPDASHVAMLTLQNGDQVNGQLDSITDDSIAIETWFGGPMNFNRVMVSKVDIQGGGTLHFRGPTSDEGWKQTPEKCWEYKRQAFISRKSGSIARDNILPEECSISFTVERKSDQLDLKLMIFSNDIGETRPRAGYELSFQRSSIYLRSGKTRNFLGSNHSRELSQNNRARIEIRASRKTGKFVLLVDGQVKEVWNDAGVDKNDFGSALHFVAGNNQNMRISQIEIGPWDGKVDHLPHPRNLRVHRGMPQPQPEPEVKPEDEKGSMKLANGDSIQGNVLDIEEGLITLETPLGEIRLPIERLRSLNLEGLNKEGAKKENKDIKAYFADGSTLVFRLDKVEGDHIIGSSQNFSTNSKFGTAKFKLSAINRIEFDIYNDKLKSLRQHSDW